MSNNEYGYQGNNFPAEPATHGPFNAAHGFRRLRFADLQVGHEYILKTIEKYTQNNEITIQTYYYLVRIVDKTADTVTYSAYYSANEDGPWKPVEPDPDEENWPVVTLTRNDVNTIVTTETGFSTSKILHHFYEEEPSNAVSVASTTFSNNSSGGNNYSDPGVNGGDVASVHTNASDPYNAPPVIGIWQQSPALTPDSSIYGTNSENNVVSGGKRRKMNRIHFSAKRQKKRNTKRRNRKTRR